MGDDDGRRTLGDCVGVDLPRVYQRAVYQSDASDDSRYDFMGTVEVDYQKIFLSAGSIVPNSGVHVLMIFIVLLSCLSLAI